MCLDDLLTFDVSVIEIYTNPGRQARGMTLLYYLKLTEYLHTTAGPAYPGFQRRGGGGGGGVLQVRPGTISRGRGGGRGGVGVQSASDPIRKVGPFVWYRAYFI